MTSHFQYDELGRLGEHHYQTYLYEYGSFKPLALVTGEGADNATPYFYHLDQIGTPLEITDATGAVAWSVDYHSYGNVAYQRKAEIVSPLRFQGQYYDAETGLHYNRHRYYSPSTGRFITPDPIGLAGGLNNYQYVKNPTGWIDPLGLTQCVGSCPGGNTSSSKPDFYVGPSGPSSTLPSTAYRYERLYNDDGSIFEWGNKMLETKTGNPTYFGFEKFDTAEDALDAFQIKGPKVGPDVNGPGSWSDARIRGTFDTLQLYEDGVPKVRVPFWGGDNPASGKLEPFAEAYRIYGDGGAVQLHADRRLVTYDKVDIIPEK
ncbi:RHS repeat-associated core domain-containing protein [Vibrio ruber]|uniref:RHS repeat-associated core domain-containing protein n=1 Tax=Vibrio ruber TaxID=184755 RepID=UPI001F2FE077|nr:RHS repeat-associated core domain-containing protein [Vibrio ruber]